MATTPSPAHQIQSALRTTHNLPPPSLPWLQALISARTPTPPLAGLIMTAKARLLASDITTLGILDPGSLNTISFPSTSLTDPSKKETKLDRDTWVQVLDVENLSRSKWDQIEALEAIERGEQTRGRQVIRLPMRNENQDNDDDDNNNDEQATGNAPTAAAAVAAAANATATTPSITDPSGTHKLVLQDAKGQKMYGIEVVPNPKIAVGSTCIGEKILLRKGTVVARGMALLESKSCVLLGGKVEVWHRSWVEGRLARLREAVQAGRT